MSLKYGSLDNILEEGIIVDNKIEIGIGVTMLNWTDRTPGTIIEVDPKCKWIKIQEDSYKRIDNLGMSDSQDYEYSRNLNGSVKTYKKNRLGKYTDNGKKDGCGLIIGYRERYYDYSF